MKYTYQVEGRQFESSESIKRKIEVETFNIGDTIDINISCSNPKISKFK